MPTLYSSCGFSLVFAPHCIGVTLGINGILKEWWILPTLKFCPFVWKRDTRRHQSKLRLSRILNLVSYLAASLPKKKSNTDELHVTFPPFQKFLVTKNQQQSEPDLLWLPKGGTFKTYTKLLHYPEEKSDFPHNPPVFCLIEFSVSSHNFAMYGVELHCKMCKRCKSPWQIPGGFDCEAPGPIFTWEPKAILTLPRPISIQIVYCLEKEKQPWQVEKWDFGDCFALPGFPTLCEVKWGKKGVKMRLPSRKKKNASTCTCQNH